MSRPPSLLPEQTIPPAPRRRAGAFIMMWLLLLLLSLVLIAGLTIILYRPGVIGLGYTYDLTQTQVSFQRTAEALNVTAQALDSTIVANAQQAFDNASTRAALNNGIALLQQDSTQAALDIEATQTAIMLSNAQQATQSALEFESTRAAFDRAATQVELNYQGTQAALIQNATAAALGFATLSSGDPSRTEAPPQPPILDERFTAGLSSGLWDFGPVTDWGLGTDNALVAGRSGAYLLTQRADLAQYVLDVDVLLPDAAAITYLLLNIPAGMDTPGGLAVQIVFDGARVTAAGLYRVTRTQVTGPDFLANVQLEAIAAVQVDVSPARDIRLQVEVRGGRVVVLANGRGLLDITLDAVPAPGALGISVTQSTTVRRISVLP